MSPGVAASIRAWLPNQARRSGEEFERTLVRFAAERLLYRLGASEVRNRCLLKGASLLAVRLSDPYRATRDVDGERALAGHGRATAWSPGGSWSQQQPRGRP